MPEYSGQNCGWLDKGTVGTWSSDSGPAEKVRSSRYSIELIASLGQKGTCGLDRLAAASRGLVELIVLVWAASWAASNANIFLSSSISWRRTRLLWCSAELQCFRTKVFVEHHFAWLLCAFVQILQQYSGLPSALTRTINSTAKVCFQRHF